MARTFQISALAGLLLVASLGCHLPGRTLDAAPTAAWVQRHGGLVSGPELERARGVAGLVRPQDRPEVAIDVLASAAPAAYAWPSGEIFVTRGLISSLDEEELAAAIAHEVGHLIDGGHLDAHGSPGELGGSGNPEMRADRIGARLLESRGGSSQAMVRMLEAVRSRAGPQTEVGRALARRIAALGSAAPADRGAPAPRRRAGWRP